MLDSLEMISMFWVKLFILKGGNPALIKLYYANSGNHMNALISNGNLQSEFSSFEFWVQTC